jgi:signal peptidase II
VAALGIALDLWTKAWAWDALRLQGPRRIIDGVLQFEFAFNPGSAFGFLSDQTWARTFFLVVTVLALLYVARLAATLPTRFPSAFVALGLIAGGALGNMHDRVVRSMPIPGRDPSYGVVDFIVVHYWPGQRWPAFNVADAVLVAGVALFMIFLHRSQPPSDR